MISKFQLPRALSPAPLLCPLAALSSPCYISTHALPRLPPPCMLHTLLHVSPDLYYPLLHHVPLLCPPLLGPPPCFTPNPCMLCPLPARSTCMSPYSIARTAPPIPGLPSALPISCSSAHLPLLCPPSPLLCPPCSVPPALPSPLIRPLLARSMSPCSPPAIPPDLPPSLSIHPPSLSPLPLLCPLLGHSCLTPPPWSVPSLEIDLCPPALPLLLLPYRHSPCSITHGKDVVTHGDDVVNTW